MGDVTFSDVCQRRYKDQAVFFMNAVSDKWFDSKKYKC